jgi:crotonobetainyl-CoA:carnitine CoA-transferase CaiB-like acyl-CoA transferase
MTDYSNGPLAGIRVIGLGSIIAGPMAGQILAEMGADVIKVEPPDGDPWRQASPHVPNESRVFLPLNRGTRSICIDLRKPEGQAVLARLIKSAHAAISNHRPDTAAKLKIDYESLSQINPQLVYVEITAYGRKGPRADMPGFDLIMQGYAGAVAAEGKISPPTLALSAGAEEQAASQAPGRGHPEPVWSSSYIDFATARAAALAVLAGILGRQRTGRGMKAETSLLANALDMQCLRVVRIEGSPSPVQKWVAEEWPAMKERGATYEELQQEYQRVVRAPIYRTYYRAYRTKDGGLCLGTLLVPARLRLLEYFGVKDARVQQPGFDENSPEGRRVATEVTAEFERRFAEQTTDFWFRELRARDIPCEPVRFVEEMPDDEQTRANGYVQTVDHAAGFTFTSSGPIVQFSGGMPPPRPSPALGQHTREILSETGYSQTEADALIKAGAAR